MTILTHLLNIRINSNEGRLMSFVYYCQIESWLRKSAEIIQQEVDDEIIQSLWGECGESISR